MSVPAARDGALCASTVSYYGSTTVTDPNNLVGCSRRSINYGLIGVKGLISRTSRLRYAPLLSNDIGRRRRAERARKNVKEDSPPPPPSHGDSTYVIDRSIISARVRTGKRSAVFTQRTREKARSRAAPDDHGSRDASPSVCLYTLAHAFPLSLSL